MPTRTHNLALTIAAIVAAHLVLVGSLVVRGWTREGRTTAGLQNDIRSFPVVAPTSATDLNSTAPPATARPQRFTPLPPSPFGSVVIPADAGIRPNVYVAKPRDTLTKIAKLHGTTAKAIRLANDLSSDRIALGQKITLPEPASGSERLKSRADPLR